MDGATPVNTANAYVIIYRMRGMTYGPTKANEGLITATAAVDSTITALIHIGNSQTLMAIWAVPAGNHFALTGLYMDLVGVGNISGLGKLIIQTRMDTGVSGERLARVWNVLPVSRYAVNISPPIEISGPAIIKLQVQADTANTVCSGSFDGVLGKVDHPDHG